MGAIKFKIWHLFYLIPAAVLGFLFWQNTKPVLDIECGLIKKTPLCGELVPFSRVAAKGGGAEIISEPVYFDVRLPRKYETAKIEIKYSGLRNDFFEFAIARDETKKNFEFAPLENKVLDNLNWESVRSGDFILYQRIKKYENVGDFLENPGSFSETLVYRADLEPKLGSMPAKGETIIDFPIRGGVKMIVSKKDGEPKIIADADSDFSKSVEELGGGLYKITLLSGANAVFQKITVDSPFVALADTVNIGDLAGRKIKLYAASSRILARAETASGLQKILSMDIVEPLEQYAQYWSGRDLKTIDVEKGNIELGGTLFFVNKNIFYPRYEPFYAGADLSKVNFILAKYNPPEQMENGGKIARAAFDISDIPAPDGKIRFLLSLPNAGSGNSVQIRSIKIKFSGESYDLKKMLKKIFNNIANI